MPEYVPVRDYKELNTQLNSYNQKNQLVYMYFYGEKDTKGVSWCSDCVQAESTIMSGFRDHAPDNAIVLMVNVGNREQWRDQNNVFRKPPINISEIPTIMRWKGVERLHGDQLLKKSLIELFFEET